MFVRKWSIVRKKIVAYLLCSASFLLSAPIFAGELQTSLEEIFGESIWTVTFDEKTLVDTLINRQETSKKKRALILHFCDTVLHKEHAEKWNSLEVHYQNYTYDPKQSRFVYSLCVNIDEQSNWRKILGQPYIYRNYKEVFDKITYSPSWVWLNMNEYVKSDVDLNQDIWQIPTQADLDAEKAYHACNPVIDMQWCSFSTFLPDILNAIMNEYSNMKLWSLYGYQMIPAKIADTFWNTQDPAFKAVVARFAKTYFGDDLYDKTGKAVGDRTFPCENPTVSYLDPNDPSGESQHCSHPKTYEFVATTLKSAKRLIDKTVLIDAKKVLAEPCEGNERNFLLMRCAFSTYGHTSYDSDMKSFNNLLLNELLRYNLFVNYYTQVLLTDIAYYPLSIWSANFTYQRSVKEYTTMLYEQQLAMQAVKQMSRMITQVGVHFPLHVGLSAYYEDLLNYRKTITKSYTPFNQLAYKWRNVQACMQ